MCLGGGWRRVDGGWRARAGHEVSVRVSWSSEESSGMRVGEVEAG